MAQKEISYKIVEPIGVLDTQKEGWNREINFISWNGGPVKIDIRDWTDDHARMSKGITLSEEQAKDLMDCLRETHAIARLHHLNNPRRERDDSR